MVKVVVDAFGADKGVGVVVEGAINALVTYDDVNIVIVGDKAEIETELGKFAYDKSRIEVEDAREKITNNESPTVAIRTKKDSSLVRAIEITKNDPLVAGMVSAGSTGAVLTGGIFKIGRIKGVLRPALCPLLPTFNGGKVCIVDCGANMDCKPEYLAQFALMGSEYMRSLGIANPRVALVSVGDEDKKGNELTHAAFSILKKLPINFVGNMEARYALSGNYDVLVCDGFVGNVLLKSVEGTAMGVMKMLKNEIKSSFSAKIGALFMKKGLMNIKSSMDYHAVGGAAFLGVEKVLVKGHGSSNAKSICAAVGQVAAMAKLGYVERIKKIIEENDVRALASGSEQTDND